MINQDFNSILDLLKAFPDEQSCINHLEQLRWNGSVVSPFDASSKVYNCKGNRYRCKNTGKYFNVRTQTLFDNTKVELRKWFVAIWLVTGHKKGISSLQLAKEIDVTQKTAWFMLHRIRNCYGINEESEPQLCEEVEIDETYVGGKNKNRHKHKKVENSQGRSHKDKAPVVGMIQRGGKLCAKQVKDVSGKTLTAEVIKRIDVNATVYTDEWMGYNSLQRVYDHSIVKHGQSEFVNGRVHTNTLEGFWSLLKRMIIGTYHFTSKKHLQKYVDEMVFRYNTRAMGECSRFNFMLAQGGKRLTYNNLING